MSVGRIELPLRDFQSLVLTTTLYKLLMTGIEPVQLSLRSLAGPRFQLGTQACLLPRINSIKAYLICDMIVSQYYYIDLFFKCFMYYCYDLIYQRFVEVFPC